MTGICDGCGQPHAVLAIVGDPHTAGVALCPQCRIPPADSVRPGVPMTDHAQREALIAQLACKHEQRTGGNDYIYCPECHLHWDYRRETADDVVKREAAAALRASAPPAPEGDTLRAKYEQACDTIRAMQKEREARESYQVLSRLSSWLGSGLGDGSVSAADYERRIREGVEAFIRVESERRTLPAVGETAPHTARTAIGEPPTGMREVPGTPGLYETEERDSKSVLKRKAVQSGRCPICCQDVPLKEAK